MVTSRAGFFTTLHTWCICYHLLQANTNFCDIYALWTNKFCSYTARKRSIKTISKEKICKKWDQSVFFLFVFFIAANDPCLFFYSWKCVLLILGLRIFAVGIFQFTNFTKKIFRKKKTKNCQSSTEKYCKICQLFTGKYCEICHLLTWKKIRKIRQSIVGKKIAKFFSRSWKKIAWKKTHEFHQQDMEKNPKIYQSVVRKKKKLKNRQSVAGKYCKFRQSIVEKQSWNSSVSWGKKIAKLQSVTGKKPEILLSSMEEYRKIHL